MQNTFFFYYYILPLGRHNSLVADVAQWLHSARDVFSHAHCIIALHFFLAQILFHSFSVRRFLVSLLVLIACEQNKMNSEDQRNDKLLGKLLVSWIPYLCWTVTYVVVDPPHRALTTVLSPWPFWKMIMISFDVGRAVGFVRLLAAHRRCKSFRKFWWRLLRVSVLVPWVHSYSCCSSVSDCSLI